ncbi:MAG: hypothetical protein QNK05_20010, partial [Myxococcota bacterium]|nr:hypothetical protein [Myxococcota bacterium]
MSRPLLWCLGALLAARLVVIVWGVGRGLELGDEGFFLLNLREPAQAPPLFAFYAMTSWIDALRQVDIVGVRWLRIACECLASLALVAGAAFWVRRRLLPEGAPGLFALVAMAGVGGFVTTASRAFGYNDLTNLCTFVATSLFLVLDAQPEGSRPSRLRLLAFVVGFALGFQ